jgi:hypothetical protein
MRVTDIDAQKRMLRRSISSVFPDSPPPAATEISPLDEMDGEKMRAGLAGLSWRDAPDDVVHQIQWDLHAFRPAAFRYYLPALMLAALAHPEWDLAGALVFHLTPAVSLLRSRVAWRFERIHGFSQPQCAAIRTFLEFVRAVDEVEEEMVASALDRYWDAAAAGRPPTIDDLLQPPPGEGVSWVRMPDVTGREFDEAVTILRESGLTRQITRTDVDWLSSRHLSGRVCRSDPDAGDVAKLGRSITLYVQKQET